MPCPLDATYLEAWATLPAFLQGLVETPAASCDPLPVSG